MSDETNTILMRFSEEEYMTLRSLTADGPAGVGALARRFAPDFETTPKVLGKAQEIVTCFKQLTLLPSAQKTAGAVTVIMQGRQGSGKAIIARALEAACKVMGLRVHMVTSGRPESNNERSLAAQRRAEAHVIIEDRQ